MDYSILQNYDMDPVPRYIYEKDILKIPSDDVSVKRVKTQLLASVPVTKITGLQFDDGSWDTFHTLSSGSKTGITTENAIRRLIILGLGKGDAPVEKAFAYLERYLKKETDYRDGKEKLTDWNEINELFTAAWMLEIDDESLIAGKIADRWAELISQCFSSGSFYFPNYAKAFERIFDVKPGKRVWDIESFHLAAVMKGRLTADTEERFIDYMLTNDKGMYYVSGRDALAKLPQNFQSRETSRFLYAHTVLSRYQSYKKKCAYVVDWLLENRVEDGMWDFGARANDGVFLPYSESWRNPLNRKIDSTLAVLKCLRNME